MKKILVSSFLVLSAFVSRAEIPKGENILQNGILEAEQSVLPPFWITQQEKDVRLHAMGGPGGKPYLALLKSTGRKDEVSVRQNALRLSAKGRYRVTAQVRTKGFKARMAGIGVANMGWKGGRGIGKSIPADTDGKWVKLEEEFSDFASDDGTYFFYIYAIAQEGVFEVADLALVAVDDEAARGTELSATVAAQISPRLLPFDPILWRIPKDDPAITFRFFGRLADGAFDDYDAVLKADGVPGETRERLRKGDVRLRLPDGATGGFFTVSIVRRADGREVFSERRTFRTVDLPREIPTAGHRRLNNFATEVLCRSLAADATNSFVFTTVRGGWVYAAVQARLRPGFFARIDGAAAMDAATPRGEVFRYLEPGAHALQVGPTDGGTVVVRAISETFNYCPCQLSYVKENPPYDWAYEKRYGLKSITTENGGSIPDEGVRELHAAGRLWLANLGTTDRKADELVRLFENAAGLVKPKFDGVTCDEQAFVKTESIHEFVNGLKAYDFKYSPEKLIYVWAIGRPCSPSLDHDFILTCINASRGRGKVMMEAYLGTAETEAEAREFVQVNVIDRIRRFREWCPISIPSTGMALGNFNQVPILSIAHHPEVDYKYYLDLQLNMVANDPGCQDLGTVGYWGSYYADDELHRWSYDLLRHYVVEGRRDMLSEKYGFRYLPGHLANGDFRGTLAPWKATGNVRTDSHRDFASRSQNRWFSRGGLGDTFAVLVREEGAAATLVQTAKGLVPGRSYCLQFSTFDVKDVKANALNPREYGLRARLSEGAKVRPDLSWVHVDRRVKGRYSNNNGVARVNLHHIVFEAKADKVEIAFDNAEAKAGEELGVNFVSLNPYYEDRENP